MEEENLLVLFSGGEWPLRFSRDGYTFGADVGTLAIKPDPGSVTLNHAAVERIGLAIRDDYRSQMNVE